MVLDGVVGASRHELGDLGPTISKGVMRLQNQSIFVLSPRSLVDVGVQVIMPSFTALFTNAT